MMQGTKMGGSGGHDDTVVLDYNGWLTLAVSNYLALGSGR